MNFNEGDEDISPNPDTAIEYEDNTAEDEGEKKTVNQKISLIKKLFRSHGN